MFRKIGQFEISVDNDLILVWTSPEFNLETVQEYALAMSVVIDRMPSVFGVVARSDAPPIMSPDVEASMRETAHQRAKRGMVAVALVTPADSGLSIVSGQVDRIYGPSGVAHAFFSDLQEACSWLREQIHVANEVRGRAS